MKLIVNIDSLPVDRFDLNKIVDSKNYEVVSNKKFKIRPGFNFMGEFLTGNPPSKTGLWMDFVRSENSPYQFLKVGSSVVKSRGKISNRILKLFSRILYKKTFYPYQIPLGLLKYFDLHEKIEDFKKEELNIFKKKYNVKTVSIISGEIDDIEKKLEIESSELVFVNYYTLDKVGHKYGPNSKEYLELSERIFESVIKIQRSRKFKSVEIMSDHGMYEVNKIVNIWDFIERAALKNIVYFVNSPVLRFWVNGEHRKIVETGLKMMENERIGRILTEKDFIKFDLPQDREFGDLIFWLNEGHHIAPDFFMGEEKVKGLHGYWGWDWSIQLILKLKN